MKSSDFLTVTQRLKKWATVEEIVAECDEAGIWGDGFFDDAVEAKKKATVRKLIKSVMDEGSFPAFASIVTTDPDTGEETRVYKQEVLFDDASDYEQVAAYHFSRRNHHHKLGIGYVNRASKRFDVQLALPPLPGEGAVAS